MSETTTTTTTAAAAAKPQSVIKSLWPWVLGVGLDTLIAKYVLGTVVLTFVLGWSVTWPMAILVAAISQFLLSNMIRPDLDKMVGAANKTLSDEEKEAAKLKVLVSTGFYYFIRLSLMGWCLFVRFLL